MNEDGAYLCRIARGIKESGLAIGAVVTAKEGPAIAPSATTDYQPGDSRGLGDEVGPVCEELCIDTEGEAERAPSI